MIRNFCTAGFWIVLMASSAFAKDSPVPLPRPPEFSAPQLSVAPPVPQGDGDICRRLLQSGFVEVEQKASIVGEAGCGIDAPVLLKAIVLGDGAKMAVQPPALVNCALARAVAGWVRGDVVAALAAQNAKLARVEIAGAYECRGRNRVVGAKLSEHSTGNALDIRAFVALGGRRFDIAKQSAEAAFFKVLAPSTCAAFATVLGPGSDAMHADNLHLDLQARGKTAHFCQWLVE